MTLQKILCAIGIHSYQVLNVSTYFHTTFVSKNHEDFSVNHLIRYKKCSCCGKRKATDTVRYDNGQFRGRHNGVERAKLAWETHGYMFIHPGIVENENMQLVKVSNKHTPFSVINGGKNGS